MKYLFFVKRPVWRFLLIFWLSGWFMPEIVAQNTFQTFGRNRVQYKKPYWRHKSTANFDIYYYDNGARLSDFAIRYLETEFDEITDMLGYTPYFKSKIFIYNSISDLQQSNVGIDDSNLIVGGQTELFKSQIEIPFTGSEVDFKIELRRGVALMLIREMMFGGSLKEMLQSSYLGKFSESFLFGAARYVAEGWSEEMDDYMRDLFSSRRAKKPNILSGKEAALVGQSIWNYIAEKYGKSNISSILNLARIIRNERNSIGSALGIKYNRFLDEWRDYYLNITREAKENTADPVYDFRLRGKNRKQLVFNEFKINPEGSKIAYSENRSGRYRVIVQDLRTKKRRKVIHRGYLAINQRYDDNVPLLSWRDNNNLGVMIVRKGEVKLNVYNKKRRRNYERVWFYFNHVSSFDFSDDGNNLILSADRKGEVDFKTGQNDIYIFNLETNNLEQITDDWYDDIDPVFLPNSNFSFLFSSNRLTDTLSIGLIKDRGNYNEDVKNFDVFSYDPGVSRVRVNRLTYSNAIETKPRLLDQENILYLSDETGILQLKKYNLKSGKVNTLSNYHQSMRTYEPNSAENGLAYLMINKGRLFPLYKRNFDFNQDLSNNYTTPRMQVLNQRLPREQRELLKNIPPKFTDSTEIEKVPQEKYEADEVDTDNYQFAEDVVKEKQSSLEKAQTEMRRRIELLNKEELKVRGPYDYNPQFRMENFVTTAQIDPLRGWGLLMSMNTSDLLENHKIRGGFFLITDLNNSDFFGEYQYLGRRLDVVLRYDRKRYVFNNQDVGFVQKHTLNKAMATISYPITNLHRVSISPFYIHTNHVVTGDGFGFTYPIPNNSYHYSGARIEYVFDNTVLNGQNMISGTRIKAYYEDYRGIQFSRNIRETFSRFGENVKNNDLNFNKFVIDARRYFRIHKDLIFAARVSYGRFGVPRNGIGNNVRFFALGGMDNWLFNRNDGGGQNQELSPFGQSALGTDWLVSDAQRVGFANEGLLFSEFVTNLRGYNYAKVLGRNYILSNLELRFPIIKYLFGKRINSNFFNNLQLVGFFDIGTAWTNANPFDQRTSINNRLLPIDPEEREKSPFEAEVNDFKNPWLAGYGAGFRTVMLGYYLKVDLAWAIEDNVIADKPKLYLSFGYDF
jgi:Tol biopolymer transport system component